MVLQRLAHADILVTRRLISGAAMIAAAQPNSAKESAMLIEVVCERTDLEQVKRDGRRAFTGHVTSEPIAQQLVESWRRSAEREGITNPVFWVRDISQAGGQQLLTI